MVRWSALVAVVACWSFALSIPIPPVHGSKGSRLGDEWRARCFEDELQQALLMACGGVCRPYSSLQYRSGALVAVVACWSFALSMSISPVHTAQRGADWVMSASYVSLKHPRSQE